MNDPMNPLVQFSPFAGQLIEEIVPGKAENRVEFENDVRAASGSNRSMFCYAPVSGCPDAKQTQVLFVLRDDDSEESARRVLEELKLRDLSEQEHFLLLFPNPDKSGWRAEQDIDFLVRCFGLLRGSRLRVGGFNGMLYYLATTPAASALMADMIALRPAEVSAAMLSALPGNYQFPEKALGVEAAAWVTPGPAEAYLRKADRACRLGEESGVTEYRGENPEVRLLVSARAMDAETVRMAWDKLFSQSRRWQNDTYGAYHARVAFTERGFVAHVKDTSLGVNDGFAHTWYEYVPPKLRGSREKAPLVFYFHGINCVPLYGAEQSLWTEIADRENLIVVFPGPATYKAWNIFDLPFLPSDIRFVLALLEHMKETYAIDESRVYLSGFSMGGAMTHALAMGYPELFAAAAPFNAFSFSRFETPVKNLGPFLRDYSAEQLGELSYSAKAADEKRAKYPELRMPLIQNAGYDDFLIGKWPVTAETDDVRSKTIRFWQTFNHVSDRGLDGDALSGLKADECFWQDEAQRYQRQRWFGQEGEHLPLYELILARRMPHAIDPVQVEWTWQYMKQFARGKDGSLSFRGKEE